MPHQCVCAQLFIRPDLCGVTGVATTVVPHSDRRANLIIIGNIQVRVKVGVRFRSRVSLISYIYTATSMRCTKKLDGTYDLTGMCPIIIRLADPYRLTGPLWDVLCHLQIYCLILMTLLRGTNMALDKGRN